ncbi:hypothetical protein [Mycolicibacterium grossiae]|uniref:hypothetical protein n=1 Tax=Mycolicibacterium grossiae TaxID=1552759 RepID=UPI000F7B6FC7|nr:hypothetical protein [Mycolicibacterium grossiae]QEM47170.1 hypothetical protein FZ046_22480 [Mycolicibacterium grossiae]
MSGFRFNNDGLKRLQENLEGQFSGGLQVPLGGSEEEAVASVRQQLVELGVTPNDEEVVRVVRDVRAQQGAASD